MVSLILEAQAMEEKCSFNSFPDKSIKAKILADSAIFYFYQYNHPGELVLVCKHWQEIIQYAIKNCIFEHPTNKTLINLTDYCHYNIFQKGILIYKRSLNTEREIRMPISRLLHSPEEFGSLDISECGKTSEYLNITVGYKKKPLARGGDKLQVWIVLRCEIEKELKKGRAKHLRHAFKKWKKNKPIGIFWTQERNYHKCHYQDIRNSLECYNYAIEDFQSISKDNLYKKYFESCHHGESSNPTEVYRYSHTDHPNLTPASLQKFSFCFDPKSNIVEN